ncbi:MAG TPA: glycerophosphodiester phosphodiesterase family protein [Pyrinomonadaceae bacterium]|nr:glycerophosphodiester phosphodiesterase family protein [Pyrinomonadaceae bacterium]
MSLPLIIGHRGASGSAPENTLSAFAQAIADGADGVEFDVRLTRDQVPVVIHDATLRRTALRDAEIASLSSSELRETDAGTWFNRKFPALAHTEFSRQHIPTLAEVFALIGARSQVLYVEMKLEETTPCAPLVEAAAREIRAHDLASRVVVESFRLDAVRELKRHAPELRTAALFERRLSRPVLPRRTIIARALEVRADEIALHRTLARRAVVAEARAQGMEALVWTADNPVWVRRALAFGLRAVITNHPARLCAERARLRAEAAQLRAEDA